MIQSPLVTSDKPVALIGASAVEGADLAEIFAIAPTIVAADGGAHHVLESGRIPDLVIGDLDSLEFAARERIGEERLAEIEEQDSTDFEKCLSRIAAPVVLALGFTGQRLDHELAVYNAVIRLAAAPCIVIGGADIVFRAPRELRLDLAEGTRLSLFPMGFVRGRSDGLHWPIDGLEFSPAGRVGTSNRATGTVSLTFDSDEMLVILPRDCLQQAIEALSG